MTNTEGEALLRAVLENPKDDAPRLIYADWLEENGDDERAEFIRLQCKSKSLMSFNGAMMTATKDESLMRSCGHIWLGKYYESNSPNGRNWNWNRGFLSEISLECSEFSGHQCQACDKLRRDICPRCQGDGRIGGVVRDLFQKHPIVRVVLTDRYGFSGGEIWFREGVFPSVQHPQSNVPKEIYEHLQRSLADKMTYSYLSYRSETEALNALSDACVAYGRELVGLPPLVKSSAA